MKTGEYLTAKKPAGGKLTGSKDKKVQESASSVAPTGGPGKAFKSKQAAPFAADTASAVRDNDQAKAARDGKASSSSAAVASVASASTAKKTGKRSLAPGGMKPKSGKRVGGTKFRGMTPPGKFENKGKGLG